MANDIPRSDRITVMNRANMQCERCGVGTNPGHMHHRRSRSVHDDHTHCPCNLTFLCGECHRGVHGTPFSSRGEGFIVSRFSDPMSQPFHRWDGTWVYPTCDGAHAFGFEYQEPS